MKLFKTALVFGLVVGIGSFTAYQVSYFLKAESKESLSQKIIDTAGAVSENCGRSVDTLTRFEKSEKSEESISMKTIWGAKSADLFNRMDNSDEQKSARGCIATVTRTKENVRCSQHSFVNSQNNNLSDVIAHQCLEKIQQVEKIDLSRSAIQGE